MKKKLSKLSKLYTEADFQLTVLSRNDIGLQELQSLFIISFLGDVSCKNIRCNLVHADLPKVAVKNFYRCFEWSTQRCRLACWRITKIFSVQLRLRRPICLWPCRSRMSRSLQVEFKFAELTSAVLGLLILPKQDCPRTTVQFCELYTKIGYATIITHILYVIQKLQAYISKNIHNLTHASRKRAKRDVN